MPRRHDLDTLRVAAFALLILYHVGMVYVPEWRFHLKSPVQPGWIEWPMVLVNRWRMSLLFLLSGITLGLVLARTPTLLLAARRCWRLLLPLAFGILAVVPVQAYCEARALGTIEPGYAAFVLRYLQLRPWPAGTFTGAEYGFTWNHLWYLAYLWTYTMLVLAVRPLWRASGGARLATWLTSGGRWLLWTLPPLAFFAALLVLAPRYPSTHALAGDWFNHARYFGAFAFGLLIAGSEPMWSALRGRRRLLAVLAAVGAALYMGLRAIGRLVDSGRLSPEPFLAVLPEAAWGLLSLAGHALYWWTALLALLGWAAHALDRPWPGLAYASAAVYPWYVLHQSLIILAAFWLAPFALGPVMEPLLVITLTIAGCALGHELIRRAAWLRPLFGLPLRARPRGAVAGAGAPA